jgi:hypothetical protein
MFRHDGLAKGRHRWMPSLWEAEFGRWVSDFGISRIVSSLARDTGLSVTNQAVYKCLRGHAPRGEAIGGHRAD